MTPANLNTPPRRMPPAPAFDFTGYMRLLAVPRLEPEDIFGADALDPDPEEVEDALCDWADRRLYERGCE